jgi:hypothetical protein
MRPYKANLPISVWRNATSGNHYNGRGVGRGQLFKEIIMEPTAIWAFVIIGGPILLGVAALWARGRAAKRNATTDPGTSGDDPSKGLDDRERPELR